MSLCPFTGSHCKMNISVKACSNTTIISALIYIEQRPVP